MIVDESYREQKARAKVILVSLEGIEISYALRFEFKTTNNQAKYEAFIVGLKLALPLKVQKIKF